MPHPIPHGHGAPSRKPKGRTIASDARLAELFKCLKKGMCYTEILAADIGFKDRGNLSRNVAFVRKELKEARLADCAAYVDMECARIDSLITALWDRAVDAGAERQDAAVSSVCRLMERRAKLLGLDQPTQIEDVTKLSDADLDAAIRQELAALSAPDNRALPPRTRTDDPVADEVRG